MSFSGSWEFFRELERKQGIMTINECIDPLLDGIRKTAVNADCIRDWPNIIIPDDKTIKSIDNKWNKLGIGEFIHPPSIKFKPLFFKGRATIKE